MSILTQDCPECDGEGRIECENCEGSGDCYCSKCEAEHECGWCDGVGTYKCENCKGSGIVEWDGKGEPPPDLTEAICSCGRPAQAIVNKEEVCSLCEAERVLRRVGA